MPVASSIHVVLTIDGETYIDKNIAIPAMPSFTNWEVTSPDEAATFAWSMANDADFQVFEFGAEDDNQEDYVTHFLNPNVRSKTIAANSIELESYEEWGADIWEVNLVEHHNSTLMAESLDQTFSGMPTSRQNNAARHKSSPLHKR